ncbi:hypothetical protein APHAL10511_000836 [Amanita phalloides]|nr:hypothetical protein APHAL10511_000836 [Amanita phalloides]
MSLLCLGLPSRKRPIRVGPRLAQAPTGIAALPTELLLEILAYARTPLIPWPNIHPPDPVCWERRKTILALSSLCRSLRTALLPVLWESIEACTTPGARVDGPPHKRKRWWKTIYKSTIRQLDIISTRQPSYAHYVKTINILITPYSACTLTHKLSRCLLLLPNLTTIQITSLWWIDLSKSPRRIRRSVTDSGPYLTLPLKSAFNHTVLPNVHTIFLPSAATPVLPSVPNARRVYLNDTLEMCAVPNQVRIQRIDSILMFIHLLGFFCPNIESFQWAMNSVPSTLWSGILLRIYHKFVCLTAVRCLDELTDLELNLSYHDLDVLKATGQLKNLNRITLWVPSDGEESIRSASEEESTSPPLYQMVDAAQEILSSSSSKKSKILVVRQGDEEVRICVDRDCEG